MASSSPPGWQPKAARSRLAAWLARRTGVLGVSILAGLVLAELAVGALVYRGLRDEWERDLARRLVQVSRLLALGADPALLLQFRAGDERLPAYELVRERLARQAAAAGLERASVLDPELRVCADSDVQARPGHVRPAALANRSEAARALRGEATPTALYRDEHGRWRLSAFAPLRSRDGRVTALMAVEARPDFFEALEALRRRMLLLGGLGVGLGALGVLLLTRVRALERAARGAERLAALGGMAGGLLHEIRNPLAAVTVYLDLLRARSGGDPRELAERALAETERLGGFLEDFQVFSGLRPLRLAQVDLAQVVARAAREARLPERARLDVQVPPGRLVAGDERLLAHALRNLLQNAAEAARTLVRVQVDEQPAWVVLSVSDDGPGVTPDRRVQVFEPTFSTKPGGMGLGLTIVERVAQAHGGSVTLTSSGAGGACFRLRLPLAGTPQG